MGQLSLVSLPPFFVAKPAYSALSPQRPSNTDTGPGHPGYACRPARPIGPAPARPSGPAFARARAGEVLRRTFPSSSDLKTRPDSFGHLYPITHRPGRRTTLPSENIPGRKARPIPLDDPSSPTGLQPPIRLPRISGLHPLRLHQPVLAVACGGAKPSSARVARWGTCSATHSQLVARQRAPPLHPSSVPSVAISGGPIRSREDSPGPLHGSRPGFGTLPRPRFLQWKHLAAPSARMRSARQLHGS